MLGLKMEALYGMKSAAPIMALLQALYPVVQTRRTHWMHAVRSVVVARNLMLCANMIPQCPRWGSQYRNHFATGIRAGLKIRGLFQRLGSIHRLHMSDCCLHLLVKIARKIPWV